MNHGALLDRILKAVDDKAYLPLADVVTGPQKLAMAEIESHIQRADFDVGATRALARKLHSEGRIDAVMLYSALHVIAASPKVRDYDEAARMVAEQEQAALRQGGPELDAHLASVDRHRGVLAFLMGSFEVALDYFSRAFERQRSAGNLANVLATLLRLGEVGEARDLLDQVRASFPEDLVAGVDRMIAMDPDLAALR
jgi:tetratricopeptide (TPR) repeat protein